LAVHVGHGSVRVAGGELRSQEVLLGSGDRLDVEGQRIEIHRGPEPAAGDTDKDKDKDKAAALSGETGEPVAPGRSTPDPEDRRPPAEPRRRAGGAGGVASVSRPAGPLEAHEGWERLARSGHYGRALHNAEEEGFGSLLERLSAPELELLADVARLAQGAHPARARQALLAIRRRFPDSGPAERAAFRLGLLALASRDYGAASEWFQRYLKTAPNGTFASDAAGRLIEAHARTGDRPKAKAAASAYLGRFPDGPYAAVARGVLEGRTLTPE
jgi:hypothetical protein